VIFLDTNVVAETMRPSANPDVTHWLARHEPALALSTIVIAEIAYGVAKLGTDDRAPRLMTILDAWRQRFAGRIHGFDEEAALIYGRVMAARRAAGRLISAQDGMIAAIALRHRAAIATRNTRDFEIDGLRVINPWHDGGQPAAK
jgi:predicted nucleic acid-binding protein